MILQSIRSSLMKFCQEQLTQLKTAGTLPSDASCILFDAHASAMALPAADVLGIEGLSVQQDGRIQHVQVMIGASTYNDTNLFKLTSVTDTLYEALQSPDSIPLCDPTTGTQIGLLVIQDGTRVLPVAREDSRPLQFVMVSLLSTKA